MADTGEALAKNAILFGVTLVEMLAAKGVFTIEELAQLAGALTGSGGEAAIGPAAPAEAQGWRNAQVGRIIHARSLLLDQEKSG
jgi:hypothetical protein